MTPIVLNDASMRMILDRAFGTRRKVGQDPPNSMRGAWDGLKEEKQNRLVGGTRWLSIGRTRKMLQTNKRYEWHTTDPIPSPQLGWPLSIQTMADGLTT